MGINRGFITLASSVANYQKMANILCKSYKLNSTNSLPFAVVTDKKSELLDIFDIVIECKNLTKSPKDKFILLEISPFDETIFIDSDVIVYNDLNHLFDIFHVSSDVSAFGNEYGLNSNKGWFSGENLGKYTSQVTYTQDLHGGIYYFRKGIISLNVAKTAESIIAEYEKYKFRGFNSPSDEPTMALAMAINNCHITENNSKCFGWLRRCKRLKSDFFKGILKYQIDGKKNNNGYLLHFGTSRTILFRYRYESKKVDYLYKNRKKWNFLYDISIRITCLFKAFCSCILIYPKIIKKRKRM